nr:reverse transcriptase domain, reverse transcriptase zinc-binding domain protein [Tanacetum cinerariifolium]
MLKHMYILKCFEEVSGLKVNYKKSKVYGLGVSERELLEMARWMGCGIEEFPFTYLGLLIGENMRRVKAWSTVVEKFKNRLAEWKTKTMSFGGRLTLGSGVWKDILKIGEEIDEFGIEFSLSCIGVLGDGRDIRFKGSVWDKGSWVDSVWCWEWDWVRSIRGRVSREYVELIGVVQNFEVDSNCRDKWRWILGEDGEFSIRELASLIEKKEKSVWSKVLNWWKVGDVNVFTIGEFFAYSGDVNVPISLAQLSYVHLGILMSSRLHVFMVKVSSVIDVCKYQIRIRNKKEEIREDEMLVRSKERKLEREMREKIVSSILVGILPLSHSSASYLRTVIFNYRVSSGRSLRFWLDHRTKSDPKHLMTSESS